MESSERKPRTAGPKEKEPRIGSDRVDRHVRSVDLLDLGHGVVDRSNETSPSQCQTLWLAAKPSSASYSAWLQNTDTDRE